MWRFRQFLSSLMSLTVWSVLFTSQTNVFGYNRAEMISYIFMAAILHGLVLASALYGLAERIYSGDISSLLLKPVSLFSYLAIEEVADKGRNILATLIESGILIALFQPEIVLPSAYTTVVFLLWAAGGVILNFLFSLLFGTLGFWSPDTWGPKFLFFIFLDFSAGKLFPLNILPDWLQSALFLTPFPYLTFMQTQVFLGKVAIDKILIHSSALLLWIVLFYLLNKFLWHWGFKNYAAQGQ
ncbi:MAG: hypothetical protein COU67_01870 [Candidatus Pacebacteria bacterium CG10_big_fil_rev_8_21_14_0_10_44_54]|nr:MAG: hypothetical protein COU67_01870 [Candidatus Pacebacteria bacterium CG10_big_fil_rev_8_21_14_0_10_44_54]